MTTISPITPSRSSPYVPPTLLDQLLDQSLTMARSSTKKMRKDPNTPVMGRCHCLQSAVIIRDGQRYELPFTNSTKQELWHQKQAELQALVPRMKVPIHRASDPDVVEVKHLFITTTKWIKDNYSNRHVYSDQQNLCNALEAELNLPRTSWGWRNRRRN